ncbi:MAG: nitrous oxide-stimulated promoter family protein [Armatimonadota bacterium]
MTHLDKEFSLVERMIRCACEGRHGTTAGELCPECTALRAYVQQRVQKCPYGEQKPTCQKCPIHCYRSAERERIKEVMRYAGSRMLKRGDLGALTHLLHGLKPVPPKPNKARNSDSE